MADWKLEKPALAVADALWAQSDNRLPNEVLRLDDNSAAIVVDIGGVDYIMTMQPLPKQRPRPISN
jgi:hypothetical protein